MIEAASSLRDRVLIQILALTGMRRAEACNLCWSDIDLERRRILIRNGKGGKQRIVFLAEELLGSLEEYRELTTGDFLFPGRSGSCMTLRNVNHIVARVGARARLENPNPRHENITPHLLRHSFARNWKRAGGSMESLQKILGHASLKTTFDVYGTESIVETEENYHRFAAGLVRRGTS